MKLEFLDLHQMAYKPAYDLQTHYMNRRIAAPKEEPDRLLLVEHEAVYTLGKYAGEDDVLFSEEERAEKGISLRRTDRGGQVTYHGPGQITGYPIVRLSSRKKQGVAWYVDLLEEVLIRTLAHFGIKGARDKINPGVWIGRDKVAAIGVRVRRQTTMHGFALNVRTDLSHYGGIVPCGISSRGVTSMHAHVPEIQVQDVKPVLLDAFCSLFGYEDVIQAKEVTL